MKASLGFIGLLVLLGTWDMEAADPLIPGARSRGMSIAGVVLDGQTNGFGNPAGLATLSLPSLGIRYADFFQIPGLGQGAFSFGIPAMNGAFCLDYSSCGNTFYHENQACLSFGKAFGNMFRAGIGLHYLVIRQPDGFENLSALSPSLGAQILPHTGMTLGLCLFNPAAQGYHPAGRIRLPRIFRAGMSCKLGDEVLVCLEAEKEDHARMRYCGGIEIYWQHTVAARFGISSGVFPGFSFGLGFRMRSLNIDLAASHHPVLGFSPVIALTQTLGTFNKKS